MGFNQAPACRLKSGEGGRLCLFKRSGWHNKGGPGSPMEAAELWKPCRRQLKGFVRPGGEEKGEEDGFFYEKAFFCGKSKVSP